MDALEQFLGGGAVASPPQSKNASVVTDQLLDSLRKVESGKDKFALNKDTKAMGPYQFMPETVQMLHKQGIEFNPFNEKEAREAARTYLGQLVDRNKGDVDKALAQYGGFVTKDPSGYVNKVKQGQAPVTQTPVPAETAADPLEAFLSGKPVPTQAPTQTTNQAPQAESTTSTQEGTMGAYVPRREPVSKVRQIVGNVLKQGFQARQQAPAFAAAVADIPASLPQFITSTAAYPAARALGGTPEEAKQFAGQVSAPLEYLKPGKLTGAEDTAAYQQSLPAQTMKFIGDNIHKGVNWIAEKTGLNPNDVQAAVDVGMLAGPKVVPKAIETAAKTAENIKAQLPTVTIVREQPAATAGNQSVGAAATPNTTMVQQALSVATPELQQALKELPVNKINVPTFQRHIEADSLPVPVRLTKGQATGDVVQLSQEQNRRGKDTELAYRFNEQNKALVDNIQEIRNRAAPDVYGTKTIENSQGIIDAYKELDNNLNTTINKNYQDLRDAAGGQFPVDASALLQNIQTKLKKQLLSNEAPKGQLAELKRLAKDQNMTFEDYLSLRSNLGEIARTAEKGNERKAASFMIEELEKLPLQKEAASLKPLADQARASARSRFQMLEKDPAFKAAVNDSIPADKFIEKFVVNGVNKNIKTMVDHLGKDSPARQHMAAGTINWLSDKAGIYGEKPNFSQAGFNQALKKLDDVNNLPEIFDAQTASHLKTLGNVAGYTQFQPRGTFVNNSNTLVGSLAEKAKQGIAFGVEKGGNMLVPGLQLGTSVMEMRARRAAEAETRKALELGAGTKQTGKNQINNLNNP